VHSVGFSILQSCWYLVAIFSRRRMANNIDDFVAWLWRRYKQFACYGFLYFLLLVEKMSFCSEAAENCHTFPLLAIQFFGNEWFLPKKMLVSYAGEKKWHDDLDPNRKPAFLRINLG
jgi:hypothetical protein